jgi:hypothetical protein
MLQRWCQSSCAACASSASLLRCCSRCCHCFRRCSCRSLICTTQSALDAATRLRPWPSAMPPAGLGMYCCSFSTKPSLSGARCSPGRLLQAASRLLAPSPGCARSLQLCRSWPGRQARWLACPLSDSELWWLGPGAWLLLLLPLGWLWGG